MIKMLIIGKNIRNETTKKWIAYDGKAGLDLIAGLLDGQRPAPNFAMVYGIKQPNETTIKSSRKVWRAGLGYGIGGEASLDAPRNYE